MFITPAFAQSAGGFAEGGFGLAANRFCDGNLSISC